MSSFPTHLGPYEIRGQLGRGGMAIVWLAYDSNLDRELALKEAVVPPGADALTAIELAARFVREARAVAKLSHPGIVTVYAADIFEGRPTIAMELIRGETLTQVLRRGPLSTRGALVVLEQLLDAAGYAHSLGIVHRDLKPDNIFITTDGRVKLADFGIAHLGAGTALTQPGTLMGTPGYMAPEQITGDPVDQRTDLFALGVIGYEMLTGTNPFGASESAPITPVLYRIVHEDPPPLPEALLADLPAGVRESLSVAMAKDPEKRFPDARAFREALAGGLSRAPRPTVMVPPPPTLVDWGAPTVVEGPRSQPAMTRAEPRLSPPEPPLPPEPGPPTPLSGGPRRPRRRLLAYVLASLMAALVVGGLVYAAMGGSGGGGTPTATTKAGADLTTVGSSRTTTPTAPPPTETTIPPVAKMIVSIGATGPFTGDLAKIGTDALQAIRMAVDDYNGSDKGGNITFAVEVGDDAADPAKAATVAEKFVANGSLAGVVGPMTSACVEAALPVLDRDTLAEISQSATNDNLSQGGYVVFHRICPTDGVQGPSIAQFMVNTLKVTSAFLIDDKGTYGQGLADSVEKGLKAGGITNIQRAQIASTDKDFSSVLSKVKAMNPSILFTAIPSPAQAAAIAKQMKSMGFSVQMMGGDGMKDATELIANAGGATEGMYATSLGPMPETVDAAQLFLQQYIAKYKETSLFTAQSYEAATIMMDAVVKAAANASGHPTRKDVNDALSATNATGILGFPIAFTEQGDLKGGGIYIIQVKGDTFVPVEAVTLAPPFAPTR